MFHSLGLPVTFAVAWVSVGSQTLLKPEHRAAMQNQLL